MDNEFIATRLLAEHRRLIEVAATIESFVAGPHPDTIARLAELRWAFVRALLMHFAHVETAVHRTLTFDRRPGVPVRAVRSSADLRSVYETFLRHTERWGGLPPAADWPDYRVAIDLLMRRIRVRLVVQESDLYSLLPCQPGARCLATIEDPIDYAAEAWKIRSRIFAAPSASVSAAA